MRFGRDADEEALPGLPGFAYGKRNPSSGARRWRIDRFTAGRYLEKPTPSQPPQGTHHVGWLGDVSRCRP